MIALRSFIFNVAFFIWCTIINIICLPALLFRRSTIATVQWLWVAVALWLLKLICGLRHQVRGMANVPAQPCIIAAKHQSAWDTLIFCLLIDGPSFVIKRELLSIPLFGWYLRSANCIPVDRQGGAKALKRMITEARGVLAHGQYIIIFPEGTRVALGQRKAYHPGVAAIYSRLEVPVVPVALNSGLFWGRRTFLKQPGLITIEFLEPIDPGLPRKEFSAELEHRIETATARLLAEPHQGSNGS